MHIYSLEITCFQFSTPLDLKFKSKSHDVSVTIWMTIINKHTKRGQFRKVNRCPEKPVTNYYVDSERVEIFIILAGPTNWYFNFQDVFMWINEQVRRNSFLAFFRLCVHNNCSRPFIISKPICLIKDDKNRLPDNHRLFWKIDNQQLTDCGFMACTKSLPFASDIRSHILVLIFLLNYLWNIGERALRMCGLIIQQDFKYSVSIAISYISFLCYNIPSVDPFSRWIFALSPYCLFFAIHKFW